MQTYVLEEDSYLLALPTDLTRSEHVKQHLIETFIEDWSVKIIS